MSHVVLGWRSQEGASRQHGRVRPLLADDIAALTGLHQALLGSRTRRSREELQSHLLDLFCRHPWRDERLPSLVYEEAGGRVVGCLGVMPRPMWMEGRPIVAAVTHSFMVEPDRRGGLAAIELLKRFLSGPQDLSLAEGNNISRRLWEAAGGTTSLLYSIRWTRPLRPARYALDLLARRGLPAWRAVALRPVCAVVDFVAERLPQSPLRRRATEMSAEEADAEALLESVTRLSRSRALRPRYEVESLRWLLGMLSRSAWRGAPRCVLLRKQGMVAGWYVYCVGPGGIGEVVQVGAAEDSADEVLDHVFDDARRRGAIAVSGQLEPSLMGSFSEKFCLFHRGRDQSWLLVHSRSERILRALQLGDAFFTRLEGEWWIAA